MGSRYYATGTQLGMLHAFIDLGKKEKAIELLNEIIEKQYLGTVQNDDGKVVKIVVEEKRENP